MATAPMRSPAPRSSTRPASTTWPTNIIHLVLARIEGAPMGTKGISLFVVPKFKVKADGSLGERNGVSCGSIEHKMGIHGNSTCVMNYDGAQGWIVGSENKGPERHVRDDERGTPCRRHPGARPVGDRLPNAVAYAKAAAGPRADRCQEPGEAGRSDHRPPGCAPHADVDPRLQRGCARARALGGAQGRHLAPRARRWRAPDRRGLHGPDDADHQRCADRSRLRQRRQGAADVRAATATSRNGACRSSCAMPASP